MFETMFERATIFSAIAAFIFFGIVGIKYMNLIKSKEQVTQTSFNPSNEHNILFSSLEEAH